MDHRYFHGIREEAARVLVKCAKESTDWIGLFHLEKAFQELFCYPDSPMPRRNDFSNRGLYFIQCAIPRAIAQVRDQNDRASRRVRSFLLDKLKFNDNANNSYADGHYLALLMRALADAMASTPPLSTSDINAQEFSASLESVEEMEDPRFHAACLDQFERYRRSDEWIPSYQNILSRTALDCKRILITAGHLRLEARDFLQYTSTNTSDVLCLSAFENILQLDVFRNQVVMHWFLYMMGQDPSPYVRAKLLVLFGRALGALAIGHHPSCSSVNGSSSRNTGNGHGSLSVEGGGDDLIVEQDSTASVALRAANLERRHNVEAAIQALRWELASAETHEGQKRVNSERERSPAEPDLEFGEALWQGVTSETTSLAEKEEIAAMCSYLWDPAEGYLVKIRYPRYWACERVGTMDQHRRERSLSLRFFETDRLRLTPRPESARWQSATESQHRPLFVSRPNPPLHANTYSTSSTYAVRPESATTGAFNIDPSTLRAGPPTPASATTSGPRLIFVSKKDKAASHHRAATMTETTRPAMKRVHSGDARGDYNDSALPPPPASAGLVDRASNGTSLPHGVKKSIFKPSRKSSGTWVTPAPPPALESSSLAVKSRKGAGSPETATSVPSTPTADGNESRPKLKLKLKLGSHSGAGGGAGGAGATP